MQPQINSPTGYKNQKKMNIELQTIVSHVSDLFERYGIKSITMDEISRELGISKKTLYYHIENKDDLVQKVIDYQQKIAKDYFKALGVDKMNAIEILMHINSFVTKQLKTYNPSFEFDLRKYHPAIYRRTKKKQMKEMYENILLNLKQGIKEGFYRQNINEVVIAKLYLNRIETTHDNNIFTKDDMHRPDFVDQIMEYHIRGVVNEKGLKEFLKLKKQLQINNQKEEQFQ